MKGSERWRLIFNPTRSHDHNYLELLGAWEPPSGSGPLPFGKGKETPLGFLNGNKVLSTHDGKN